jgi:glycosyltransferase-like protein
MNDPYAISRVVARPLSVALYTHSLAPRGSVVHCAALADALVAQGHDVTVYGAAGSADAAFFRPLRARLELIPVGPGSGNLDRIAGQHMADIERYLTARTSTHDIHHAEDWLMGSVLCHVRDKLSGPVVRTVHHVERFDSPSLEHCQAQSIRNADFVLSVSEATREEVLKRYRVESERVESGIDMVRFTMPPARDVVELGARLGLSSAGPVLLSYGGIEQRKNSIGVLRAFRLLRKRLPSACWVIVGESGRFVEPHYREEFERELAQASEDDRRALRFAGVLSERDLLASYQLADAVVCASLKEGFGMCALEALAAGVPLVASRRPPFTEQLDARCATLVDPESPSELSAALWRVLLCGRGDQARVAQGVERARRFSWQRAASDHVRLYGELRARRHEKRSQPASAPPSARAPTGALRPKRARLA